MASLNGTASVRSIDADRRGTRGADAMTGWMEQIHKDFETGRIVRPIEELSGKKPVAEEHVESLEDFDGRMRSFGMSALALFAMRAKEKGWYCKTRTIQEEGKVRKVMLYFMPVEGYQPKPEDRTLFAYQLRFDPDREEACSTIFYDLTNPELHRLDRAVPVANLDYKFIHAELDTFLELATKELFDRG
jgi:hypothetical protein